MCLGAALKMQKRADSAVKAMQRAAELMPEDGEVLSNLGCLSHNKDMPNLCSLLKMLLR